MARGQLCARPGCGRPSTSVLTFDYSGQVVYLDPPGPYDPIGAGMCDKHAARQTGPVGWAVIDRRVLGRMVAQQQHQADVEATAYAMAYADAFGDDEFDEDDTDLFDAADDLLPGEDDPTLFPYPVGAEPKGPNATLFSFADEARERRAKSWTEAEDDVTSVDMSAYTAAEVSVALDEVEPHDEFFAPGFADVVATAAPSESFVIEIDDEPTLFDDDVWSEERFDAESRRAEDEARQAEDDRRRALERLMTSAALPLADAPLDRWSSALDRSLGHPAAGHTASGSTPGQRRAG